MRACLALALSLTAASAFADSDFSFVPNPVQSDFRSVAKDIVAALDYKALGPAEASGVTGFSVGGLVTYTPVQDKAAWKRLTGQDVDAIGMAGLSATKGLPFGIDLGAFYAQVPGTDAKLYGGEVRWVPIEGGITTPAVAFRGTYSKMTGEDDVKFDAASADVSVSKGFAFITPYVGAGYTQGTVTPDSRFLLKKEDVNQGKFFAGARITLGFLQITPEYLRSGDSNSYNLKASLGF